MHVSILSSAETAAAVFGVICIRSEGETAAPWESLWSVLGAIDQWAAGLNGNGSGLDRPNTVFAHVQISPSAQIDPSRIPPAGRRRRGGSTGGSLPRPLTLDAALSYALAHNPMLRRVTQQVAEHEGIVMEAVAKQRPNVHATGSYGYTQSRLFEGFPGFPDVPMPDPNAWQVDVSVRRLVYSGGGIQAQIHGAQERTEAARAIVTTAVNATLYQVQENFLGVLLAREQIRVHEEALRVLEGESERTKVRRNAGAGADFEILRAQVAIANARPALIRAQNAYRAQQDALRTTLGGDAGLADGATDLDVRGTLAIPPLTIALAEAIQTARAHRPELQIDDRLIARAEDIKCRRSPAGDRT